MSAPIPPSRVLALAAAVVATLSSAVPAAHASSRLIFGFSDNLPMVAGPRAVAPAAALGSRGYTLTLTWRPGRTALTPEDARGLVLALNAIGKAPRPLIRVTPTHRKRHHGSRAKPRLVRAQPRVILDIQTLARYGVPLDDSGRTDFCTYARSAIASFPKIKDVVIGNEANSSYFWKPQFNWDGTSAAPAAYEALLARCYDVLHAFRPHVNVGAPATSPDGNDNPLATSNVSHSPTSFILGVAAAYKASGRTTRIFDTVVHHPYSLFNDERPYVMHPLPYAIGEGDWNRLVSTYRDAFAGTPQAVPGRCLRRKCVAIWYLETGFQTTPPPGAPFYYGTENVRTIPDVATSSVSAANGSAGSQPDQASQIRDAVRLAYCQPYVDAIFNFLIRDDPNLLGYQSGLLWADWSRKGSFHAVKRVVRAANRRAISCKAPRAPAGLAAELLTGPTRVSLIWQAARSPVGVAGYYVYRNGDRLGSTASTTYADNAVAPGARYTYAVRAFDAAGKIGSRSRRVAVSLP